MTKEERLADLERRQREIADEIKEIREENEPKFINGHFYEAKNKCTLVLCVDGEPYDTDCFCGINLIDTGYFGKHHAAWIKDNFYEVYPTGWSDNKKDSAI